jgi:hypothetical protein
VELSYFFFCGASEPFAHKVTLRKEGQVEPSGETRLNNLARHDAGALPWIRVNPNLWDATVHRTCFAL